MKKRTKYIIAAICTLLVIMWAAGTFDRALSGVGLNAQDCIQNGFGATFCGDDAIEYENKLDELERELEAISDDFDY